MFFQLEYEVFPQKIQESFKFGKFRKYIEKYVFEKNVFAFFQEASPIELKGGKSAGRGRLCCFFFNQNPLSPLIEMVQKRPSPLIQLALQLAGAANYQEMRGCTEG